MIDRDDAKESRFPPDQEEKVSQEIKSRLIKIKSSAAGQLLGIAGGANGGDILFHEACLELNIPSELFLALPPDKFKKESVSFAGGDWDQRFDLLTSVLPVFILPQKQTTANITIWERANEWMLEEALKNGSKNLIVLTLWNGKEGNGAGGTQHMAEIAKNTDAIISSIDINKI